MTGECRGNANPGRSHPTARAHLVLPDPGPWSRPLRAFGPAWRGVEERRVSCPPGAGHHSLAVRRVPTDARHDREATGEPCFEVAVFGRVSSGKSSLLNHIAGLDVLPVGVTPVTAVPTRLEGGKSRRPGLVSESRPRQIEISQPWEYASEEGNRGNGKHVTAIAVRVPSSRLGPGSSG